MMFENPQKRLSLRKNFPDIACFTELIYTIEDELDKLALKLENIGEVYIAFPQKNPLSFPDHNDKGRDAAEKLQRILEQKRPDIKWRLAEDIYEERSLQRSRDQSSTKALVERQKFTVLPKAGCSSDHETVKNDWKSCHFVLTDHMVCQGSTLAELASFITHNGGTVLAAANHYGHLAQTKSKSADKPELTGIFSEDNAGNNGYLPEIAIAFSSAAKREGYDFSPQQCLEKFENALQAHGNSTLALTHGECQQLITTLKEEPFSSFMTSLGFPLASLAFAD